MRAFLFEFGVREISTISRAAQKTKKIRPCSTIPAPETFLGSAPYGTLELAVCVMCDRAPGKTAAANRGYLCL